MTTDLDDVLQRCVQTRAGEPASSDGVLERVRGRRRQVVRRRRLVGSGAIVMVAAVAIAVGVLNRPAGVRLETDVPASPPANVTTTVATSLPPATTAPTTTAPPTTAPDVTATPLLEWAHSGVTALPWGTDRATVLETLTALLGPPDQMIDDLGALCGPVTGSLVRWDEPFVFVTFDLTDRLGSFSADLSVLWHASGIDTGDTFDKLVAAEPDATWAGPIGAPGFEAPDYYEWRLNVGDTTIRGGLSGPPPAGVIETYVHLAGPYAPASCGE